VLLYSSKGPLFSCNTLFGFDTQVKKSFIASATEFKEEKMHKVDKLRQYGSTINQLKPKVETQHICDHPLFRAAIAANKLIKDG
jgi:hypothetical protein